MKLSRSLGVAVLCTALVVTQSPAHASSTSSAPVSSSANSIVASLTAAIANSPSSSDTTISNAARLAQSLGLPSVRIPSAFGSSDSEYPLPTNPNITKAEVLSRTVEPTIPNLERWVVASPAMQRNVEVVVRVAWETFITKELTKLVEDPAQKLNFNGKRAIGGLSMGAIGAVHIANQNPDLFKGVFGISGCYSTQEPVGRLTTKLVVESRGGNVNNMWGPDGSELWKRHDVPSNPEGLRNMAVYLASADGGVLPSDLEHAASRPFYELPVAVALEQGTLHCTKLLDSAMRARGMNHQVVDLLQGGVHDWPLFNRQLRPAWDAIKGVLY